MKPHFSAAEFACVTSSRAGNNELRGRQEGATKLPESDEAGHYFPPNSYGFVSSDK